MNSIGVIGLGYVGLPLAVALGRVADTIGFDLSSEKITAYRSGIDPSGELDGVAFSSSTRLGFFDDPVQLKNCDVLIVAVPTPVDNAHRPDFRPLRSATRLAGENLKKGALVVFESTVYPGATEEICVPELERASGLTWKKDFHVGYSPERINPGDTERTLERIVKVVSGDDADTLEQVASLYELIIEAGVYRASSIRVAEAAKVIENTQRDLNIALMNELAIIFERLGIDTQEVLEAAGTKWNFLPFRPGLVGGHCIGVDPYYLTHKADMLGYHPQVILAGRRINDGMGKFIAEQTIKQIAKHGHDIAHAKVIVLGLTFKENCADIRNSRVIDVIEELRSYEVDVRVHDPLADRDMASAEYGIELTDWDDLPVASALVMAVAHDAYKEKEVAEYARMMVDKGCFVDVKSCFPAAEFEAQGLHVWRL